MKARQLFTLAVILILLGIGIAIKQNQKQAQISTQEYSPLEISFDETQIARISLQKGSETPFELKKEGSNWLIGDWRARADKEKVETLISKIKEAKGELRAKGKDVFPDFGIQDEEGIHVRFYENGGKEIAAIVIGTANAGADKVFIRNLNSETVYLADVNLLGAIGVFGNAASNPVQKEYWVAANFLELNPDKVT
jgi:hypothetical protein